MIIQIERKWKKETYTIGRLLVNGEFLCNTLELKDVGLTKRMPLAEIKAKKVFGETAIPTGKYRIDYRMSWKFDKKRAYLVDVPAFVGIMIHEGNTRADTLGCILVGMNTEKGTVTDSKHWLGILNKKIEEAIEKGEPVSAMVR
ncbi:MAG: DUF5675 family protein [Prevotella sp.]|nr:DUF5675 family protein [Prevotella sp.]